VTTATRNHAQDATGDGTRYATHRTEVAAPAETVYALVADAARWPLYFAPNVHVEHLERGPDSERLRIWATANGEVKNWTSRRDLDAKARTVTFRQEVSTPPVAAMGGRWSVHEVDAGHCVLQLDHDWRAVDDAAEHHAWIEQAVDRNSTKELAATRELAELGARLGELSFSFEDTVQVDADPADVYDFLARAELWPERLPHVDSLDLDEDDHGVQVMKMNTRTKDGSVHTTESVRVCFAPDRIVYKQTVVPALMTAHTGQWTIRRIGDTLAVTSRHSVTIKPTAVESVLGEGKTVAEAREFVHKALSTNSTTTLRHAKAFAEARRG
jgi:aromatase